MSIPAATGYYWVARFWAGALLFAVGAAGASRPDTVKTVRLDSSEVSRRQIPAQSLTPFLSDDDFRYDREPHAATTFWEKTKQWLAEKIAHALFSRESAVFWRVFSYFLAAAVLIFVVMKLLQTDLRGLVYHAGPTANRRDLAENIHRMDFERLLDDAVRQKQYRPAVRFLFLALLNRLSTQGLIEWRIDKTNRAYLDELKKTALRPAFAEIVFIFEHVWYGEFAIDENVFQRARAVFERFDLQLAEA